VHISSIGYSNLDFSNPRRLARRQIHRLGRPGARNPVANGRNVSRPNRALTASSAAIARADRTGSLVGNNEIGWLPGPISSPSMIPAFAYQNSARHIGSSVRIASPINAVVSFMASIQVERWLLGFGLPLCWLA